jgi:Sigma-70, region 4
MARVILPAHLRNHGPGTAGRNKERDALIAARRAKGESFAEIGKALRLSGERVRQIVQQAKWDAQARSRGEPTRQEHIDQRRAKEAAEREKRARM